MTILQQEFHDPENHGTCKGFTALFAHHDTVQFVSLVQCKAEIEGLHDNLFCIFAGDEEKRADYLVRQVLARSPVVCLVFAIATRSYGVSAVVSIVTHEAMRHVQIP